MDIRAALVADGQAAVVVEPGQGALHHPAMAPSRALESMPLRAMRTRMWRRRSAGRQRGMSEAWSACSLAGRLRRRPSGCSMGGTASTSSAKTTESWRLAPVSSVASGRPAGRRQVAFSAGVSAVGRGRTEARPPFGRDAGTVQPARASRCDRRRRGDRAASDSRSRRRPPASRVAAASRSCRSHSPSPGAASPMGCRS